MRSAVVVTAVSVAYLIVVAVITEMMMMIIVIFTSSVFVTFVVGTIIVLYTFHVHYYITLFSIHPWQCCLTICVCVYISNQKLRQLYPGYFVLCAFSARGRRRWGKASEKLLFSVSYYYLQQFIYKLSAVSVPFYE